MTYTDRALLAELRDYAADAATQPVVVGPFHSISPTGAAPTGIAVNLVGFTEDDRTGNVEVDVQLHFRLPVGSGTFAVLDEAERLRVALVAIRRSTLQTVRVVEARRLRASPVLFDSSGRPERFDTYMLRGDRPEIV